jgi:hypothetical protein
MRSRTAGDFWELLAALPPDIQRQAYKAYRQFLRDPFHPSLRFKEVDKRQHLWSARVSRGYRAIGQRHDGEITRMWIGTHADYDKRISRP